MHVQREWLFDNISDIDELRVYYRTSISGTWTLLKEYTEAYESWTTEEDIILPNLSSTYQIAFEYTDKYGYGVGVDNLIVQSASCVKPTGLAYTLTPGNGTVATLSWTENGSASDWQICLNGDETNLIVATTNPWQLTNLTPEITYTTKVRANCGSEQSTWSEEVAFTPADAYSLTMNDGTSTNSYVPYYSYYHDASQRSEFIIPASSLEDIAWGTITSMKFYPNYSYTTNASIKVYLMEVVEETFSEVSFYEEGYATVVYDGTLTISPDGLTIAFSGDGFQYQGGNLLVGFYQANGGSSYYSSSNCPFYGVSATGASISRHSGYSGMRDFLPKTTFTYLPGEAPACPKPKYLAFSDVTGHGATITWTSDADAWEIQLGEEEAIEITHATYTFTGLAPETAYSVKVRANCGDNGYSDWTNEITFTTDVTCHAPTDFVTSNITAYTADLNWNSLASEWVVAYKSNFETTFHEITVIENPYTLTGLDPETAYSMKIRANCGDEGYSQWLESSFTTLPSCLAPTNLVVSNVGKRSADLAWGSNNEENAWQICINDDETNLIDVTETTYSFTNLEPLTTYNMKVRAKCSDTDLSHWSSPINFTTTEPCPAPTDLTVADIASGSAVVSWTSESDVELEYCNNVWKHYDNGVYPGNGGIGTGDPGSDVYWAIMLPPTMLIDQPLTTVSVFEAADYSTEPLTIMVYSGGDTAPETLLYEETVETEAADAFHEITLGQPVTFDATQNLWIVCKEYGTYPAIGCYNVNEPNGRWISLDGEDWQDVGIYNLDYTWMIRAAFGNAQWVTIDNAASPQTLTGLTPETDYLVRVKHICGDIDGESKWTTTSFTTTIPCPAPTGLTVADITAHSANVSWNGGADNFEMEYATARTSDSYTYDFDDGTLQGWTNLLVNTDGGSWLHSNDNPGNYNYTDVAHSGTGFAICYSFIYPRAYNTDAYFVSPESYSVDAGASLHFWYDFADDSYPEYTEVCIATAANPTASDFTPIWTSGTAKGSGLRQAMGVRQRNTRAGNWREVALDQSAYAGQSIWIAFHDVNYNMDEVWIDDITVNTSEIAWIPVGTVTSPYLIGGLDEGITYMVRVRANCGIDGESEWTVPISFITVFSNFTKTINAYSHESQSNGWYLIASPIALSIPVSEVGNMTDNQFDLYRFNQAPTVNSAGAYLEWENYKCDTANFLIESGIGYLYANSGNVTLTFTGDAYNELNEYDKVILLRKTDENGNPNENMRGWNLVGNPYSVKAYLNCAFYVMNPDGDEIIASGDRNYIEPMEGAFVLAENDGDLLTFYKTPVTSTGNQGSLSINVMEADNHRGNSLIDRAVVHFGEGKALPKFMLNQNRTKVYIPQHGQDYAIACVGRDVANNVCTEVPVNFKAAKNGTYTLSFTTDDNVINSVECGAFVSEAKPYTLNEQFAYLHLIDNMTGTDVDLLSPSLRAERSNPDQPATYTFTAKTTDDANRFRLVFASAGSEAFAYISNGEIVVVGNAFNTLGNAFNASLQVVDMTGRVLVRRDVLNTSAKPVSITGVPTGEYMLHLIDGDSVRTQKIVIP